LRILIGCEFSGRVRNAFRHHGYDAWSCDLIPAWDYQDHHIMRDVMEILNDGWDLMIAHPPCTYLASSGARWWPARRNEQSHAIEFIKFLWEAPIKYIAIENPIGALSTKWCRPTQIVQPWWFGDHHTKATCWWLKGLPPLIPTKIIERRDTTIYNMRGRGVKRQQLRSITPLGMAQAIADQWGRVVDHNL
jgi:hypothetical protein